MWTCTGCTKTIEDEEQVCYHCGSPRNLRQESAPVAKTAVIAGAGAGTHDASDTDGGEAGTPAAARKQGTLLMILLYGTITGAALALLGILLCLVGSLSGWFAAQCVGVAMVVIGGVLSIRSVHQLRQTTAAPPPDAPSND